MARFCMGIIFCEYDDTVQLKSKLPPLVLYLVSCKTRVLAHEKRVSSLKMRLSSCKNHWSIYFGRNYKQLACEKTTNFLWRGKVNPTRASSFSGSCFTSCFKRYKFSLPSENGSDQKQMQRCSWKLKFSGHFNFLVNNHNTLSTRGTWTDWLTIWATLGLIKETCSPPVTPRNCFRSSLSRNGALHIRL